VLSQNTWASQRSVRFGSHLGARTYHDGYKDFAPTMLFDVEADPHEQRDLAGDRPDLVDHAMALLTEWQQQVATTGLHDRDPLLNVLREGPSLVRGQLPAYLERLRRTGREEHARRLELLQPAEC
jgi:arylsulfatase A-like enzyme